MVYSLQFKVTQQVSNNDITSVEETNKINTFIAAETGRASVLVLCGHLRPIGTMDVHSITLSPKLQFYNPKIQD